MTIHAPAKLNLCLFLGPRREDGLHELCSLFEPLTLADVIEVSESERDEVICAGVEGENLAAGALAGLRELGWGHRPLRIEIEKRIPLAAGLGGGSADAAAVLRLAAG
jgi:4-diphosphocytidyl-2-C-methyl-D-erythritol kinase